MTGIADVVELDLHEDTNQDEEIVIHDTGGASAAGSSREGVGGDSGITQIMGILPPAPVAPLNSPKINNIVYPPLVAAARDIGIALQERVKNLNKVKYRLDKIDTAIVKLNTSLSKGFDPSGTVVCGFMSQAANTLKDIEVIMARVEENNTTIAMIADLIESTTVSPDFDPAVYQSDIAFVRATSEHNWETAQAQMLERMVALDNAKSVQTNTKNRWDRSANSSRSASPAHNYVMWSMQIHLNQQY